MADKKRQTRIAADIEARLDSLDPASERYHVLSAAFTFKASWVALGEQLTCVRESAGFKQWGYQSFEAYCQRELHIKQDTANKLTRSFAFLRDHEPHVLQDREHCGVPSLDVVHLMSQAQKRANVSDTDFAAIRKEIFANEAHPTRNDVVKRFREVDPEAFKVVSKSNDTASVQDLRKALLLAERLNTLLMAQENTVAKDAIKHAHAIVDILRKSMVQDFHQGAA